MSLLDRFGDFFTFHPAWQWGEKVIELPDWGMFSQTPTLSPLLSKVEIMEKRKSLLLTSTSASNVDGGSSRRGKILLEDTCLCQQL